MYWFSSGRRTCLIADKPPSIAANSGTPHIESNHKIPGEEPAIHNPFRCPVQTMIALREYVSCSALIEPDKRVNLLRGAMRKTVRPIFCRSITYSFLLISKTQNIENCPLLHRKKTAAWSSSSEQEAKMVGIPAMAQRLTAFYLLKFSGKESHLRGCEVMICLSGGLNPNAVAGRPSVTRFTQSSWTGLSTSGIPAFNART